MLETPRIGLLAKNCIDSDYINHSASSKNCYMTVGAFYSENIFYSTNIVSGKDCVDCYRIEDAPSERLYECQFCYKSYNSQFCYQVHSSSNCYYSFDLKNCNDCFLCYNLRGKSYCFLNEQLTREEYKNKIKSFNLGSQKIREKLYAEWLKIIQEKAIHRFSIIDNSQDCSGNLIYHSKGLKNCFECSKVENAKYTFVAASLKESMDGYQVGTGTTEFIYETHALIASNASFCHLCYDSSFITYCDTCHNSQNLFGCVSVNKGEYMILNKKYKKDEYVKMKEKIIEYMKKTGEYGEFFPMNISPFAYNETQGQVYMPMTEKFVKENGIVWQGNLPGTFGLETIDMNNLPDDIKDVDDSIIKETLKCAISLRNYRITKDELFFYKRNDIPIPRIHPEERYKNRLKLRSSRHIYHRTCMKEGCMNEFETSYAPDRPEIVYCEKCYQNEVY